MYVRKCANISKRAFGMAVIKLCYQQQTLVVSLISGLWSLTDPNRLNHLSTDPHTHTHTHIV